MYRLRYLSVCWPPAHSPSFFPACCCRRALDSWSARSRRGSSASSIVIRFASLQTRKRAPSAPSVLPKLLGLMLSFPPAVDRCNCMLSSNSGATRLSHPIVLIAPASLIPWTCRLAIRFVVRNFISRSDCSTMLLINGLAGYNVFNLRICACKSSADA